MENTFTSFLCPSCHTEIEATLDMCGVATDCPACGAKITVPTLEENDGVIRHTDDDDSRVRTQAMKSRTIRIELGDL